MRLTWERLLAATGRDSLDDGIRLDARLEPIDGPGATVQPAVYVGEVYQSDRRWPSPGWPSPGGGGAHEVFIIDNVPSQANRCEEALRRSRPRTGVPEMVLDLSGLAGLPGLPPHMARRLSSWQFPHRNGDVFLRGSELDGIDFCKHPLGGAILDATHDQARALISWCPQSLLYGFWRSRRRKQHGPARHARAWVSEMVGWQPSAPNGSDGSDGSDGSNGSKGSKGSNGQGSVEPVGTPPNDRRPVEPVSFRRVTQQATVSFAQLRRIGLGGDSSPEADAAARALLVAMGLHGHVLAFGQGFTLRPGADLRVSEKSMTWLGPSDEQLDPLDGDASAELLRLAKQHAGAAGVPLDGWDREPLELNPKDSFMQAVSSALDPEEAH